MDRDPLQGKTPISYLQEICTKKGITPQYNLVANEGAVHEPLFVYRASAGPDFAGTGKGPSKKKAKHNAALDVLKHVLNITNEEAFKNEFSSAETNGTEPATNPVGELQEMTQKKLWPPPIYEYSLDQGPPHAKEFVCNIRLWNLSEKGVGKSKKLAKRNAAVAMIKLLKQGGMPQADFEQNDGCEDEALPLDHTVSGYSPSKDGRISSTSTNDNQRITQCYQKMLKRGGLYLKSLQEMSVAPNPDLVELLQKIGQEQKFQVKYIPIHQLTTQGQFQCLVQLTTNPGTVCYGLGASVEECKVYAAYSALQYLKLMTAAAATNR